MFVVLVVVVVDFELVVEIVEQIVSLDEFDLFVSFDIDEKKKNKNRKN